MPQLKKLRINIWTRATPRIKTVDVTTKRQAMIPRVKGINKIPPPGARIWDRKVLLAIFPYFTLPSRYWFFAMWRRLEFGPD